VRLPRRLAGRRGCRADHVAAVDARAGAHVDQIIAERIASSSCSTTKTVLPRRGGRLSVSSRRSLSFWWRPIEGSSRT